MTDTFFGISRRKFTDDELKLMATAVADAVAQQARIDELEAELSDVDGLLLRLKEITSAALKGTNK